MAAHMQCSTSIEVAQEKTPKTWLGTERTQQVEKIIEGTKVQDQERVAAESFAQDPDPMGMGGHKEGTEALKRAFGRGRDAQEFDPTRTIPSPDERTSAMPQAPRALLRELLDGTTDPARFPQDKVSRSRLSGDALYASINLEGLATTAKLREVAGSNPAWGIR